MVLISREEAKLQKLSKYFTGKTCVNGHTSERKTADGKCVECKKESRKQYRKIERSKDSYKEWHREWAKSYYHNKGDKSKVSARRAVANALASGKIQKQPCSVCGTNKRVQAHHDDYSKPLDVIWLCQPHHHDRHKELGMNL